MNNINKMLLVVLFTTVSMSQVSALGWGNSTAVVAPRPSQQWKVSNLSSAEQVALVGSLSYLGYYAGAIVYYYIKSRSEDKLIGKINGSHFLKNFEKKMNSFYDTYNCNQLSEDGILANVLQYQEANNITAFKEAFEGYMDLVVGLCSYSNSYHSALFTDSYSDDSRRAASQFLDGYFYDLNAKCQVVNKHLEYARGLIGLYATQLLYEEAFKCMNGDSVDVLSLIDSMQSYKDFDYYQLKQFTKAPYLALVGMFESSIDLVTYNDINNQEMVSKYPATIAKVEASLVKIKKLVEAVKRTDGYEKEKLAFIASGQSCIA